MYIYIQISCTKIFVPDSNPFTNQTSSSMQEYLKTLTSCTCLKFDINQAENTNI